jgi:acylphosphatase
MDKTQNIRETGRIHIFVSGKVQGVGFRAYVQHSAKKLGLSGWVRNVGYSQVETIAEGNPEILKRFVEVLRSGPRRGRVDDLSLRWEDPLGDFKDFDLRFD